MIVEMKRYFRYFGEVKQVNSVSLVQTVELKSSMCLETNLNIWQRVGLQRNIKISLE